MSRLVLLAAVVICSPAVADLPADVEIEKLLIGRWSEREVEGEGYITTTTEFFKNGRWSSEVVIAKGKSTATIKLSGGWKVLDKVLIATVETSSSPAIPAGTRSEDQLLEITKKACRFRDDDGKEHTKTRMAE